VELSATPDAAKACLARGGKRQERSDNSDNNNKYDSKQKSPAVPKKQGYKKPEAVNTKKAETRKGEVGRKTTTGPTRKIEGARETRRA